MEMQDVIASRFFVVSAGEMSNTSEVIESFEVFPHQFKLITGSTVAARSTYDGR